MSSPIVPYTLDDYFQTTPIGSLDKAISNNLYGINHRQTPGAVPDNKELQGYTFFTRPQLNLQSDNIRNVRLMNSLMAHNGYTIQSITRALLDPRIMAGYNYGTPDGAQGARGVEPIFNALVDNTQAFIPILTNNIRSISGFPDIAAPQFTSDAGLYNEMWSIVDGVVIDYEARDIDMTFRNTRGDPILYMFYIWVNYAALVFENKLVPYLDMITENRVDYNTRIYRLVMDPTKRYVRKIACTGAGFPVSVPTGAAFDFNAERPYSDQIREITVRFRTMGFRAFDDRIILNFNQTVQMFNPSMKDQNREQQMVKLGQEWLTFFNNRGYPRIEPNTYELEWWIPKTLFENKSNSLFRKQILDGNDPSGFGMLT